MNYFQRLSIHQNAQDKTSAINVTKEFTSCYNETLSHDNEIRAHHHNTSKLANGADLIDRIVYRKMMMKYKKRINPTTIATMKVNDNTVTFSSPNSSSQKKQATEIANQRRYSTGNMTNGKINIFISTEEAADPKSTLSSLALSRCLPGSNSYKFPSNSIDTGKRKKGQGNRSMDANNVIRNKTVATSNALDSDKKKSETKKVDYQILLSSLPRLSLSSRNYEEGKIDTSSRSILPAATNHSLFSGEVGEDNKKKKEVFSYRNKEGVIIHDSDKNEERFITKKPIKYRKTKSIKKEKRMTFHRRCLERSQSTRLDTILEHENIFEDEDHHSCIF